MGLSVSWEVVLFFALGMLLLYGAAEEGAVVSV